MLIFELVSESEESARRVAARPGATWPRFERQLCRRNRFLGDAWEGAAEAPSQESYVAGRGRED
jgi:hypothetical protein